MKTKPNPSAQTRSQAITKLRKAFPESFDYMFLLADLMVMGEAQHAWVIATVNQGLNDKERYENILFKGYGFYKYRNNDQTPFKSTDMMIESSFREDIYEEYKGEIDEFLESPRFQLLADASEKRWLALFHFFLSRLEINQDRSQRAKYEKLGLIFYLREANTASKFLRIIVDLCFFNKKLNREKFLDDVLFILKIHFAKLFCLAYEYSQESSDKKFPAVLANVRKNVSNELSFSHPADQVRAIKESKKVTLNQRQQLSKDILSNIKKDLGSIQALAENVRNLTTSHRFELNILATLTFHLDKFVLSLQEALGWNEILEAQKDQLGDYYSEPEKIIEFSHDEKDYVWVNMNSNEWSATISNGTCGYISEDDIEFDSEATVLILFEVMNLNGEESYKSLYFFSYSPHRKFVMEARGPKNSLPNNENLIWPLIESGWVVGFAGRPYSPELSYGWKTMSKEMFNLIKDNKPEMLLGSFILENHYGKTYFQKIKTSPKDAIIEEINEIRYSLWGEGAMLKDPRTDFNHSEFVDFLFMSSEKKVKYFLGKKNIYYLPYADYLNLGGVRKPLTSSYYWTDANFSRANMGLKKALNLHSLDYVNFRDFRTDDFKVDGHAFAYDNPFDDSHDEFLEELLRNCFRLRSGNVLATLNSDDYKQIFKSIINSHDIDESEKIYLVGMSYKFLSEVIRTRLLHSAYDQWDKFREVLFNNVFPLFDYLSSEDKPLNKSQLDLISITLEEKGDLEKINDLILDHIDNIMSSHMIKNFDINLNPYLLPAFDKLMEAMNGLVESYDEEE